MSERPDSHEADALESLVISDGWSVVRYRVLEEIERKRDQLERVAMNLRGPDGGEGLQGFIAACRMFLELPYTIAAEIKQGEK